MNTRADLDLGRRQGPAPIGTAIFDDAGTMIASMPVVDFPTRQALDDWLAIEPYVSGDVWRTIEIRPARVGQSFAGRPG